jgi:hypothetical protein
VNTSTGYRVGGDVVLTSNTLGANVVNSSLSSVGTLTSLNLSGGLTGTSVYASCYGPTGYFNTLSVSSTDSDANTTVATFLAPNNTVGGQSTSVLFGTTGTSYGAGYIKHTYFDAITNCRLSLGLNGGTAASLILKDKQCGVAKVPAANVALDVTGNTNLTSGSSYKINYDDVLTATTLGSSVVNSSLTSLGTVSDLKATVIQCGGTANTNANGALRFNNVTGEKACFFASEANSHYSIGVGSSSFNFNSNSGAFTFYKGGTNDEGTTVFEIDDDTVTFTQSLTLPPALPTLTSSMLGYVETAVPTDFVNIPADGTDTTILSITDLPVGVWLLIGKVQVYTALDTVNVTSLTLKLVSGSTTIAQQIDNLDWSLTTSSSRGFSVTTTVALSSATSQYLKLSAISSGNDTTVKSGSTTTATYFQAVRIA